MGGRMSYGRFRSRNHLGWRPEPSASPYPDNDALRGVVTVPVYGVLGDLNRLEQDYLGTSASAIATGDQDSLIHQVARDAGVDPEIARDVLAAFFGYSHDYPIPQPFPHTDSEDYASPS